MIATDQLLELAAQAAQAAGTHALENRHRRHEVHKLMPHDIKLQLDIESQQKAEETILAAFPDHNILGEENRIDAAFPSDYEWIIDPIDGTVNFAHGLTYWCSSVAVRCGGAVLAGAVYVPVSGELFSARADGPAELNGSEIRVSEADDIAMAMIATGLNQSPGMTHSPVKLFERVVQEVQKVRLMGAAALDICRVACGRFDGYFETGLYLWDTAAAGLIAERAGGRVSTIGRVEGHRHGFLASNAGIHDALLTLVNEGLGDAGA